MLSRQTGQRKPQQGSSLLEVLITIVILAFGLLGLAAFQSKVQVAEVESYQRAQAILALADMSERINANRRQAANYVSPSALGTDDGQPISCTTLVGPNRDLCEWSNALKGASETTPSANVGGMSGARGCITQVQAPDLTLGVCKPAIYRVDVAWQGMQKSAAQTITCGQGSYGADDSYRRVISSQIIVGVATCQ
jgi:type IV pilus assembly protein PilV